MTETQLPWAFLLYKQLKAPILLKPLLVGWLYLTTEGVLTHTHTPLKMPPEIKSLHVPSGPALFFFFFLISGNDLSKGRFFFGEFSGKCHREVQKTVHFSPESCEKNCLCLL